MGVLGIEQIDFLPTFFNMDISLKSHHKHLKLCLCAVHNHVKGNVSQIFNLGLSFCLMKSRKLSLKNDQKLPFF